MDVSSLRKNNYMNFEKDRKIREIDKEVLNHKCIDCNNDKPEYISLNNAIFICKNCYKNNHQKFPPNISRVTKNYLKSLTLKELQYLYFGGNKKMLEFMKYEYPRLIKISSFLVYKTIALEYYRNWLAYLVEGGNKPIKPDIEIAYNSIEEKNYKNNKLLNNNNTDVITIDFFNDCYNYNDKNNNTITNFIKKKPDSDRGSIKSINNNYKENIRLKYQKGKIEQNENKYKKLGLSNNLKDILNYYKIINKNNYEKYIHNTNKIFYKTQSPLFNDNYKNDNEDNYYINNMSKRSHDNCFEKIDNNCEILNNKKKFNNTIIKAFKTNNRIYSKPKRNFKKSFVQEDNYIDNKINNLNDIKIDEVYNFNNDIKIKKK